MKPIIITGGERKRPNIAALAALDTISVLTVGKPYMDILEDFIDHDKPIQRTIKRSQRESKPLNTSAEQRRRLRQMERGLLK